MGRSSDVHKLILSDNGIDIVPMKERKLPDQKKKVGKNSSQKGKLIPASDQV